jgi:hypothetical protein
MSRTTRTNGLPLLPTRRHAARGLLDELAPDRVPPSAQAAKLGRAFDQILVGAPGDDLAVLHHPLERLGEVELTLKMTHTYSVV